MDGITRYAQTPPVRFVVQQIEPMESEHYASQTYAVVSCLSAPLIRPGRQMSTPAASRLSRGTVVTITPLVRRLCEHGTSCITCHRHRTQSRAAATPEKN